MIGRVSASRADVFHGDPFCVLAALVLRAWKQKHGSHRDSYAFLSRVEADDLLKGAAIHHGPLLLQQPAARWVLLTRVLGRVPR